MVDFFSGSFSSHGYGTQTLRWKSSHILYANQIYVKGEEGVWKRGRGISCLSGADLGPIDKKVLRTVHIVK